MRNFLYINNNNVAELTTLAVVRGEVAWVNTPYTTLPLKLGYYVRVQDGNDSVQLCYGAKFRGMTLVYRGPDELARDCNAKLYKTRRGYDAAVKRAQRMYGTDPRVNMWLLWAKEKTYAET